MQLVLATQSSCVVDSKHTTVLVGILDEVTLDGAPVGFSVGDPVGEEETGFLDGALVGWVLVGDSVARVTASYRMVPLNTLGA